MHFFFLLTRHALSNKRSFWANSFFGSRCYVHTFDLIVSRCNSGQVQNLFAQCFEETLKVTRGYRSRICRNITNITFFTWWNHIFLPPHLETKKIITVSQWESRKLSISYQHRRNVNMIMIIMMATMMMIIIISIIIMIRCATLHFNLAPVVCIWVMQLIQKLAITYIGINVLVQ